MLKDQLYCVIYLQVAKEWVLKVLITHIHTKFVTICGDERQIYYGDHFTIDTYIKS